MITTGRITTRRGARVHLAIDGIIADSARRIAYPNQPGMVDSGNLCRRCWTPARIEAAQKALTTALGADAEAARQMLARVADTLASAAEQAELDDLAARIVADLAAQQAREDAEQAERDRRAAARTAIALSRQQPLSALGQMRAAFATTHAQPRVAA